jgi:hypothetical protein
MSIPWWLLLADGLAVGVVDVDALAVLHLSSVPRAWDGLRLRRVGRSRGCT